MVQPESTKPTSRLSFSTFYYRDTRNVSSSPQSQQLQPQQDLRLYSTWNSVNGVYWNVHAGKQFSCCSNSPVDHIQSLTSSYKNSAHAPYVLPKNAAREYNPLTQHILATWCEELHGRKKATEWRNEEKMEKEKWMDKDLYRLDLLSKRWKGYKYRRWVLAIRRTLPILVIMPWWDTQRSRKWTWVGKFALLVHTLLNWESYLHYTAAVAASRVNRSLLTII